MHNIVFESFTANVAGLSLLKIGIVELCCRDKILLTSEGEYGFVIGEPNQQIFDFSRYLKCSLVQRMNERRNVSWVGLIQYLKFGKNMMLMWFFCDISRFISKNSLIQEDN